MQENWDYKQLSGIPLLLKTQTWNPGRGLGLEEEIKTKTILMLSPLPPPSSSHMLETQDLKFAASCKLHKHTTLACGLPPQKSGQRRAFHSCLRPPSTKLKAKEPLSIGLTRRTKPSLIFLFFNALVVVPPGPSAPNNAHNYVPPPIITFALQQLQPVQPASLSEYTN